VTDFFNQCSTASLPMSWHLMFLIVCQCRSA